MNLLTRILYHVLQWTFGILQNLAGLAIFLALRIRKGAPKPFFFHGAVVSEWQRTSSMGMGMFIFIGRNLGLEDLRDAEPGSYEEHILSHEYGHTVQSVILGPFYLFVIGLPSAIWCNFKPVAKKWLSGKREYESFYPEKWATRLGVRTEARHRKPEVLTTKPEDTASV